MSYLELFRHQRRILAFGVSLAFFSSFGQTFFISLSAPRLIEDFGLSNASWGGIYSTATLISALCLPSVGQWMDRQSLVRFSCGVAIGLSMACLLLSLAWHSWILLPALVGLRLTGQGLMGLTAATTMARAFVAERGVALSISSVGFPLGEILLPPVVLGIVGGLGWRISWALFALIIVGVLLPLIRFLLSDPDRLPSSLHPVRPESASPASLGGWTRAEVLRDYRFYLLIPSYVTPGFLATGLILHQFVIAQHKGWSEELMATSFVAFGVARLAFSLLVGPIIDRFTAVVVFPFCLIPLITGVVALWLTSEPWAAGVYYALMGISLGFGSSAAAALWAEHYGIAHLGAIKSMTSMIAIVATAISPVLLGWLMDIGVPLGTVFIVVALGMVAGSILGFVGCRPRPSTTEIRASRTRGSPE